MQTTNVRAFDLNYHHYSNNKYDRDIVNSIPFHRELHEMIIKFIDKNLNNKKVYTILDLGVGTGITSKIIQGKLPKAEFDLVDFSHPMLTGAKKRFGKSANYIFGDYSKLKFTKKYDIVVSVIGLHHQTHHGKKLLFKKIFSLLKSNGIFILGDLMTHKDPKIAALNQALHFHHLVEKSTNKKTLKDWAHHHYNLNNLVPIEDQKAWLEAVGFKVKIKMLKMNTALLVCKK